MLVKASARYFMRALLSAVLLTATSLMAEEGFFDPTKMAPPADANKSFSLGPNADKGSSVFGSANTSFNKSFATKGADGLFGQSADVGGKEFLPPSVTMDKTYAARSYALPGNFTGYDESKPNIALKESGFSSQSALGYNRMIEMPTYTGPEADRIKQDMEMIDKTLGSAKDLPNRSLTVQEVRDLLNHNAKPGKDPAAPDAKK